MRCLVIDGSGHADGHTAAVCGYVQRRLSEEGWEVSAVAIPSSGIVLCRGCGRCRDSGCPIDDPLSPVVADVARADAVVFASPVRFNGLSSQMKALADRLNMYWYGKVPGGRNAYGILVGGSPEPEFRHALQELRSVQLGIGMGWGGEVLIPGTDGSGPSEHAAEADALLGRITGRNSRTGSRT